MDYNCKRTRRKKRGARMKLLNTVIYAELGERAETKMLIGKCKAGDLKRK